MKKEKEPNRKLPSSPDESRPCVPRPVFLFAWCGVLHAAAVRLSFNTPLLTTERLPMFCPLFKCHRLTTGSMRGGTGTKGPELASTSAHHWVFFLRSLLQSCKLWCSLLKSHWAQINTLDELLWSCFGVFISRLLTPDGNFEIIFCDGNLLACSQAETPQPRSLILIVKLQSWSMTVLSVDVSAPLHQNTTLFFTTSWQNDVHLISPGFFTNSLKSLGLYKLPDSDWLILCIYCHFCAWWKLNHALLLVRIQDVYTETFHLINMWLVYVPVITSSSFICGT